MASGFDPVDLRSTFETPGPHRSTNQPKLGKGYFFYSISIIFNRLPERTMGNIVTENEEAALRTVGAGLRTDRQTNRYIHRHTDDRFYDNCPSPDGQL